MKDEDLQPPVGSYSSGDTSAGVATSDMTSDPSHKHKRETDELLKDAPLSQVWVIIVPSDGCTTSSWRLCCHCEWSIVVECKWWHHSQSGSMLERLVMVGLIFIVVGC